MIRLIVCDMDGTLASENSQLPSDFALTLEKLGDKNIKFAIASGRPYKALYDMLSPYGDEIIYISENGAYVRYKNEILYKETFDKKQIKQFERFFTGRDQGIIACCGYKCYYIKNVEVNFKEVLDEFRIGYETVDDFGNINDDIFQLTAFYENGINSVEDMPVFQEMSCLYQVVKTHSHWLDIYKKHINKGTGIEKVYKRFRILPEETVAFGDFFNDIPMFEKVFHSYCMESAPEDVKKYARYIVNGTSGSPVTQIIRNII